MHPLLPPKLPSQNDSQSLFHGEAEGEALPKQNNAQSSFHGEAEGELVSLGVAYPQVHCAFADCSWASDQEPCHPHRTKEKVWMVEGCNWSHKKRCCCKDAATCLWAHLAESHSQHFEKVQPDDLPAHYASALCHKENQHVPKLGPSVDRRTFRRLQQTLTEDHCQALICACCARVHATGPGGEVAYISAEHLFTALSAESVQSNWDYQTYRQQYGTVPAVRARLCEADWVRRLPPQLHSGATILCCPEDIRCDACDTTSQQLCGNCRLPVCRRCIVRMHQASDYAIPEALGNDNWYGFPTSLLYSHKVRWIEAAAASPVWTSVVSYYLEADRGHLLEEHIHRQEHRAAVRGNVSSFCLPWEEVLAALDPESAAQATWGALPHKPEVLRSLIQVTIKGMRYNEAIQWAAGAKLRPWVVVALLHHLIDLQHPMCNQLDSPEVAKEDVSNRVHAMYGSEESAPLVEIPEVANKQPETQGGPSPAKRVKVSHTSSDAAAASTEPTKHATPETMAGASFDGQAFAGDTRPHILSEDYSATQFKEPDVDLLLQLGNATDQITIQTGHSFWDQWHL